jgi:hypothetical protein
MSEQPRSPIDQPRAEKPGYPERQEPIKKLSQTVALMTKALALVLPTFVQKTVEEQKMMARMGQSEKAFPDAGEIHENLMEKNGSYAQFQRLLAKLQTGPSDQQTET